MKIFKKNVLSAMVVLGVVFAMLPLTAYADTIDENAVPSAAETMIVAPETQYDDALVGTTSLLRALYIPTSYWNLASSSYSATLAQVTNVGRLYTNYYFSTNSSSRIYVDYNVSALGGGSGMTIGCYDITSGSVATTFSVTGITTSAFKTGSMYFYNLNANHMYAIYFIATEHNVSLHGTATVRH
ncbi:MAG: hypothetical protein LBG97_06000 [Coriobacteriales bacterium]|jgi:hypothetical protein|nr:hypothetical protein [Coriobacteriales bacterium]